VTFNVLMTLEIAAPLPTCYSPPIVLLHYQSRVLGGAVPSVKIDQAQQSGQMQNEEENQ
jgi:hypothetical protein